MKHTKNISHFSSVPIPTSTHAPAEYFQYKLGVPPRSLHAFLIKIGWKDEFLKPTDRAIHEGLIIPTRVKNKKGRYRSMYSREHLVTALTNEGFPRKRVIDPVSVIVNLVKEIRKTRPSKRQILFDQIAERTAKLETAERILMIQELRKYGINPADPWKGARR